MASPVTPLDAAAVPRNQYRARLDAWSKILSTEDKRYQQVSDLRLWVVIAGIAAAWWNLPYLAIPAVLFVALMVWHVRIDERRIAANQIGHAGWRMAWRGKDFDVERSELEMLAIR